MLNKSMQTLASDLNLQINENNAYGIYNGYLISLYLKNGKKTISVNCYMSDDALSNLDISDSIKDKIDIFKIIDYNIQNNCVIVTMNDSLIVFKNCIDFLIKLLADNDIPGNTVCSSCGEALTHKAKRISDGFSNIICCTVCSLELLETENNENNINVVEKKETVLSILMAILGGIIGSFLFIGVYFVLPLPSPGESTASFEIQYIICILSFLTTFLVWFGYHLFSKKRSITKIVSVAIISLIFVVASQYFAFVAYQGRTYTFDLFYNWNILMPMVLDYKPLFDKLLIYTIVDVVISILAYVIFVFEIFGSSSAGVNKIKYSVSPFQK